MKKANDAAARPFEVDKPVVVAVSAVAGYVMAELTQTLVAQIPYASPFCTLVGAAMGAIAAYVPPAGENVPPRVPLTKVMGTVSSICSLVATGIVSSVSDKGLLFSTSPEKPCLTSAEVGGNAMVQGAITATMGYVVGNLLGQALSKKPDDTPATSASATAAPRRLKRGDAVKDLGVLSQRSQKLGSAR